MSILIICEKPQQARNMKDAIGSNSAYQIEPAQGHLYRLKEPEEVNPDWKVWNTDILSPASNKYPLIEAPDQGRAPRIARIKNALKYASEVIIATDCDREGQAIGEDIINEMKYKGPVKRAMFSNEDPDTLREAIKNAKPNEAYANLYDAAVARRQADQIFNLSMTRIASLCLKPDGWPKAVGVGRVKTPTFGIVCARELEILNFVPVDYFVVSATLSSGKHTFKVTHRTTGETKILDRAKADALSQTVQKWQGSLVVKTERKRQAAERPMDLPTLQKRAAKWGWSVKKTLEIAQTLYDEHKISSYPRAETRYLNEILSKDAEPILNALKALYPAAQQWAEPIIRTGKNGVFSDAGIGSASHHAIIPNVKKLSELPEIYAKLNNDERRLFDLIAHSYLAAIGPEYVYDAKTISITVPFNQEKEIFATSGSTPVELGWKALYLEENEDEENESNDKLPPVENGSPAEVTGSNIEAKKTKAPTRFNQGDLIEEMSNAWRYVDDPAMQERLKEAKGLGTPATRDSIIASLLAQGWLTETKSGKKLQLQPTESGLEIYHVLKKHAHWLIDPGFTSQMELRLDAILDGRLSSDRVIAAIVDVATKIRDKIVEVAPPKEREVSTTPSEAQIALAVRIASEKGIDLPESIKTDRVACSAFINEHRPATKSKATKGKSSGTTPSEKQVAFAEQIASKKNKKIPATVLKDGKKLSEWIDKNIK